jgi:predicted Holliday junction resolvase-like endonuclease
VELLIIIGVLLVIILLLIIDIYKKNNLIECIRDSYSRLLSQKKQSEIVTGQVSEKLAPFLEEFKHDPQKSQFIGQPIDFIVFEDDEVVFVEVKSQNSQLTSKQRRIRDLVKNKKVRWELVKIK